MPEVLRGRPLLTARDQFVYVPSSAPGRFTRKDFGASPAARTVYGPPRNPELRVAPRIRTDCHAAMAWSEAVVMVATPLATAIETRLPSLILHLGIASACANSA